MSKTEKKRNFYLSSYTQVFLSLPKVLMISLLVNSVTKLLTSKINTGFPQMWVLLWNEKNTLYELERCSIFYLCTIGPSILSSVLSN